MNETKECFTCHEVKNTEDYMVDRNNKDGLRGQCRLCINKIAVERRRTPEGRIKCSERNMRYQSKPEVKARAIEYYANKRSEYLGNLTMDPSSVDSKYIYIMQWGELLKVGISNHPKRRLGQVQNKLASGEVELLAVCSPYAGRTVDNESLAHYDLRAFSTPVTYKSGTVSREWFSAGFDVVLSILEQYGDMELING